MKLFILCIFFAVPKVMAAEACASIGPGESIFFSGMGSRGTPVDAEYILSRDRDDPQQFTAKIRLRFTFMDQTGAVGVGNLDWMKRQQDLENEVRVCLAKVNPHLLGPNGQHLQITLQADSELLTSPYVNVQVYPEAVRSNQNQWNTHPDCEIVTHEILHGLGLVDGYQESEGYGASWLNHSQQLYDCRSLAPEDSVMRDPYQTLEAGKSLLYEEEFNTITAGKNCSIRESKYLECAQNAQKTSYLFLRERVGCVPVAPECHTLSWLGNKRIYSGDHT